MIRAISAAALFAIAALSAPASAQDPRLVERLYDPATVVRIDGRVNVQAVIRFGEDESIQNIGIGNSQDWQVTPTKGRNIVFVKPLSPRAATNMTVVTDKRTYLFDLVASPTSKAPLYQLTFVYPEEPEPELAEANPEDDANPLELAAANDDLAVLDPSMLNFEWSSSGDAALLPERVFDNGEATFLVWGEDASIPAILVKDHEGTLGPVNFAPRGDTLVLDFVPGEIFLRSGDDEAVLLNLRPATQTARAASGDNGA